MHDAEGLALTCLNIEIRGLVQGVGFRPFVYRLARQFQQNGWICNSMGGVSLAIEGAAVQQKAFIAALQSELPPFARIDALSVREAEARHYRDFKIIPSAEDGQPSAFVLPDLAPCPACLEDMRNPHSRYFRYPFTSCSYCGPRYSIMYSQPYDRARTSMASFAPCKACMSEYRSADNRRFHAQTIACPVCGPSLSLFYADGKPLAHKEDALALAVDKLMQGFIVALKGVGGFQLLADAQNPDAIQRLRERKQRPYKPLALMVADLAAAKRLCDVNELGAQTLQSSSAPIVLLPRLPQCEIAAGIAEDNAMLGLMLPASPLHFLLAQAGQKPLVATSGNLHNEPLCHDDAQAFAKLGQIADFFLIHDRAIVRPLDDSIVRLIAGQATVLRRARGYTPLPVTLPTAIPHLLAVGGQWKNTLAVSIGQQIVVSQHLGDLESADCQLQFLRTVDELQHFYNVVPQAVAHDLHPDYVGSGYARKRNLPRLPVPHHYAHVLSCMAEHRLTAPLLGIAWDGSGLGEDGSICGSEFLLVTSEGHQTLARLRPIRQPGGDQAARQPRRSALAVLHSIYGDNLPVLPLLNSFKVAELALLKQMLAKHVQSPTSSSAGRLFDTVASILDLCHINRFEGQAAMRLEQLASKSQIQETYSYTISDETPAIVDWRPMIEAILADLDQLTKADIAAKFHHTLAQIITEMAVRTGQAKVVLSGGCFQNALLAELTLERLTDRGFTVYRHGNVPPNDGGLAVGQLYAAAIKHSH